MISNKFIVVVDVKYIYVLTFEPPAIGFRQIDGSVLLQAVK
jgi:hypothetical protein